MPFPAEARDVIAQAIDHSAVAYALARHPEHLRQVVDSIEQGLDAAGYVLLTRESLDDQIEEGNEEANYEDGQ